MTCRVPDAVQRVAVHRWSGTATDWNGPRKSGLPDLRAFERRSRVNPRSVSAAHHFVLRCARDTATDASPAGLTTQVGFIRLAHLKRPKSGKPDFGWSIFFARCFAKGWIAGSGPAMTA